MTITLQAHWNYVIVIVLELCIVNIPVAIQYVPHISYQICTNMYHAHVYHYFYYKLMLLLNTWFDVFIFFKLFMLPALTSFPRSSLQSTHANITNTKKNILLLYPANNQIVKVISMLISGSGHKPPICCQGP